MDIAVTPSAGKFIARMLRMGGPPGSGFRLEVRHGGCSGLAAEFSVEASPLPGDATVEAGGMRLFLPAESCLLLDGVTIDFRETPTGTGFVFHDPKGPCRACGPTAPGLEVPGLKGSSP
jgi:iron-sulfur cluster assembly protein